MPTKPIATPKNIKANIFQYFLIATKGLESSSISGLYTPNITHITPPDTPGSIAPPPISIPLTI